MNATAPSVQSPRRANRWLATLGRIGLALGLLLAVLAPASAAQAETALAGNGQCPPLALEELARFSDDPQYRVSGQYMEDSGQYIDDSWQYLETPRSALSMICISGQYWTDPEATVFLTQAENADALCQKSVGEWMGCAELIPTESRFHCNLLPDPSYGSCSVPRDLGIAPETFQVIVEPSVSQAGALADSSSANECTQAISDSSGFESAYQQCLEQAGCSTEMHEAEIFGVESLWPIAFSCPWQKHVAGTIETDPSLFRDSGGVGSTGATEWPTSATDGSTAINAPTVLSGLPLLGDFGTEAIRLGTTTAAATVLAILVALPTQLLNSALEQLGIGFGWLAGLFARRKRDEKTPTTESEQSAKPREGALPSLLKALPVFVVASIITGFVEPAFGLNFMSLRLVLTALAGFLLINYLGTVLVWSIFHRKSNLPLPVVRVHYFYLLVILITVLGSRMLSLAPPLIFGSILAIETGRVVFDSLQQLEGKRLGGRLQLVSALVVMGLGVLAYAGYNLSVLLPADSSVTIREFFSALTIESLATLPLLMLPLAFMPGVAIYQWRKSVSVIMFAVAMTLFMFVLVPLPSAWDTVNESFVLWLSILLGYSALAIVVWAVVALTKREPKPAAPTEKGSAS